MKHEAIAAQSKIIAQSLKEINKIASADSPEAEEVLSFFVTLLQFEAKKIREFNDAAFKKSGNSYKGKLQSLEVRIIEIAKDLERFVNKGEPPYWYVMDKEHKDEKAREAETSLEAKR